MTKTQFSFFFYSYLLLTFPLGSEKVLIFVIEILDILESISLRNLQKQSSGGVK